MLKVEPIQNGVVIDHIPAGRGMEIYRLLHLESKHQAVALLINGFVKCRTRSWKSSSASQKI